MNRPKRRNETYFYLICEHLSVKRIYKTTTHEETHVPVEATQGQQQTFGNIYSNLYIKKMTVMMKQRVYHRQNCTFYGLSLMFYVLFCCAILTTTPVIASQCTLSTKKGTINLNPLSKRNQFQFEDTGQHFIFYTAICANTAKLCKNQASPSSYYLKIKPDGCVASLGDISRTHMTLLDDTDPTKGVALEYWGGQIISGSEQRTRIKLICDLSTKNTPVDQLQMSYVSKQEGTAGTQYWEFQITTAYACPGFGSGSKRRIVGVGGGLLIAISSLILLYLLIGSAIMKFKFQKEGWDILIHHEYLKQMVLLVWEGVLFTWEGVMALINKLRGNGGGMAYQEVTA